MKEHSEDIFDEKTINKAIKKGKRKTIRTIVLTSITVFVVLNIANFAISLFFSQKIYKEWDAYIRLTTPNGYISETIDSRGFLGGMSHYKINKNMKIKSVVVEQKQNQFGLIPSILISRGSGGGIGITGEDWQIPYKENGWREVMFFHPDVEYKKYKNDTELINEMQGEKIYEVALSFDQPYKQSELPIIVLPEMTWLWLNTYSDAQLTTLKQEAQDYDWSANFIREHNSLGLSTRNPYTPSTDFSYEYKEFLSLLKKSGHPDHKETYKHMKNKKMDEVEILGVVIYGTKEEIAPILKEPFIKAVSLGGMVDNY